MQPHRLHTCRPLVPAGVLRPICKADLQQRCYQRDTGLCAMHFALNNFPHQTLRNIPCVLRGPLDTLSSRATRPRVGVTCGRPAPRMSTFFSPESSRLAAAACRATRGPLRELREPADGELEHAIATRPHRSAGYAREEEAGERGGGYGPTREVAPFAPPWAPARRRWPVTAVGGLPLCGGRPLFGSCVAAVRQLWQPSVHHMRCERTSVASVVFSLSLFLLVGCGPGSCTTLWQRAQLPLVTVLLLLEAAAVWAWPVLAAPPLRTPRRMAWRLLVFSVPSWRRMGVGMARALEHPPHPGPLGALVDTVRTLIGERGRGGEASRRDSWQRRPASRRAAQENGSERQSLAPPPRLPAPAAGAAAPAVAAQGLLVRASPLGQLLLQVALFRLSWKPHAVCASPVSLGEGLRAGGAGLAGLLCALRPLVTPTLAALPIRSCWRRRWRGSAWRTSPRCSRPWRCR